MAKKQNLKLTTIKKVSKQFDETETYTIKSNHYKGEQVTFYPLFSDSVIDELFTEYQQLFLEAKEKEFELSQDMVLNLLHFLAIKHFTHFKNDIPSVLINNSKDGILEWIKHFTKTGLYKELLEEMFEPQEIFKLTDRLTDFLAASRVHTELENEAQKKYRNLKLKNQFVFDQLQNSKIEDEHNDVV